MSLQTLHGGTDAQGTAAHDFSTNSNACGPCPEALAAVQAADAAHYPDPRYTALRRALAQWHGVDMARVLLAGSASEFIHRITAWSAQRGLGNVWVPPHSYADYLAAAQAWRLAQAAHPTQAELVWSCEPSSPLGQTDPTLSQALAPDAVCVLDCAYAPLRLEGAPIAHPQTWQLWTPNKALGLTGVRAAYVIAPAHAAPLLPSLEALAPSWPIGAHGVAMLQAWLTPSVQAWLTESRMTLRAWKTRQLEQCSQLGWQCTPSLSNYFCARLPVSAQQVPLVLEALRARGIKLRDAESFGLPGQVRVAVLPPASQDALCTVWRSLGLRTEVLT
jgi:histidinol-phosphate aminotransferase